MSAIKVASVGVCRAIWAKQSPPDASDPIRVYVVGKTNVCTPTKKCASKNTSTSDPRAVVAAAKTRARQGRPKGKPKEGPNEKTPSSFRSQSHQGAPEGPGLGICGRGPGPGPPDPVRRYMYKTVLGPRHRRARAALQMGRAAGTHTRLTKDKATVHRRLRALLEPRSASPAETA